MFASADCAWIARGAVRGSGDASLFAHSDPLGRMGMPGAPETCDALDWGCGDGVSPSATRYGPS